jgi:hypothetical protein
MFVYIKYTEESLSPTTVIDWALDEEVCDRLGAFALLETQRSGPCDEAIRPYIRFLFVGSELGLKASFPPRLTATLLPSARDSHYQGSQRTSTSRINAMPGTPRRVAPRLRGLSVSPLVADLMSLVDHATVLHGLLSDGVALTR